MRGRFQAATAAGGLTPFVGREDELRSLMSRWERVLDGEGQVALIIGEAGIGKSRLLQRFHEQIAGTPHTWIEAGAGAFFQNTPFYPVSEMLRQFLGDGAATRSDRGTRTTADGVRTQGRRSDAPDRAAAESAAAARVSALDAVPEQQRRRLLATLVEWVLGSARAQPLVIATEDLHWVDPSTLELIQLLVEQGATAPLLLLYTARPEFRAPWPLRAHHTQITLNRLGARDIRTMIAQVAASKALSDDTVATVVERTGGVPLFVEELTRALLESGECGANRARDSGDLARLVDGAARPARAGQGSHPDRRGNRQRVFLRIAARGPSDRRGKSATGTCAVWPMRNCYTCAASRPMRPISSSTR